MEKRVSLKDIARKVGVSVTLVSYVLNNQKEGRINREVAQKIRDVAAKLQYLPNQVARSLKTNKTFMIGLIVADISNPFSSSLARIIEDEADQKGYTVIFGSSDETSEKSEKLTKVLLNRRVDGLIISPPEESDRQIAALKNQGIPFVLVDRFVDDKDINQVGIDNYSAAYDAVRHLVQSGRKKIAMIAHDSSLFHLRERQRGYLEAIQSIEQVSKHDRLELVKMSDEQEEVGQVVNRMLSGGDPADAVLFGSNRIAIAALRQIDRKGVRIPDDLAVVTFDETEAFDFFYAPLTYIRQPLQEMGRIATNILLDNIQKTRKAQQVYLPAELVVRASSSSHMSE